MHEILQRVVSTLPTGIRQELSRSWHGWQIRRNSFRDDHDPYFSLLTTMVGPGDWVIDVGANVGHYTLLLSRLVGPNGRVVAIEPIPQTFELLCSNARRSPHANISLINIACSDAASSAGMAIPLRKSGLPNFYMAQIQEDAPLTVLCLPLDSLLLPSAVRLIKVDAEGHDAAVLRGAESLISRDRPTILVEGVADELTPWLVSRGYRRYEPPSFSPNQLYVHDGGMSETKPAR